MATAFQMLCKEPVGIGITFYRDFDCTWVVQHHALTTRLRDLEPGVKAISAEGGGDIPEAVLEGLQDAILKNKWSKRSSGSTKVMILLGDAPPHPQTIAACIDLAKQAAAAGMRIHAAKITTDEGKNDLSAFDEIAKAGGGSTVDVTFHRLLPIHFVDAQGKEIPFKPQARPEVQLIVAPPPPGELPGEKILTHVLEDTISPQYRNRVEPLARTLLAYCQGKSEPEQREAFFQNTPGMMKSDFKSSQGK
jgi:hypothetical protein